MSKSSYETLSYHNISISYTYNCQILSRVKKWFKSKSEEGTKLEVHLMSFKTRKCLHSFSVGCCSEVFSEFHILLWCTPKSFTSASILSTPKMQMWSFLFQLGAKDTNLPSMIHPQQREIRPACYWTSSKHPILLNGLVTVQGNMKLTF